jgi:hypothetical protein
MVGWGSRIAKDEGNASDLERGRRCFGELLGSSLVATIMGISGSDGRLFSRQSLNHQHVFPNLSIFFCPISVSVGFTLPCQVLRATETGLAAMYATGWGSRMPGRGNEYAFYTWMCRCLRCDGFTVVERLGSGFLGCGLTTTDHSRPELRI